MANEVETRMGAMLNAIILGEDYPSELNMSRIENILQSIIDDTEYDDPIYSRIEFLLLELKKKMEENPTIEELTVTQNGTYQEEGKAYSPVNVNVEGGPVIAELRVTENGTYEESGKAYSPVIVDVDEGPTIESLNVTANGTYSEEGKAYTPVVVNIEGYKLEDMPTGAIATITDAAALPLNDLKVSIEPVQAGSGDPSPSNVRPISGWTECNISDVGINLWDEEWELGGYRETNGSKDSAIDTIRSKNYIQVSPNTSYFCTYGEANKIYEVFYYDKNKNYINFQLNNGTVTTPSNCRYMTFRCMAAYGTTYNNDISINYPSTDTSYHAYKGKAYNIQFPSEAGTVYGGTLDVTNGVLIVDRVMVDMGTLDWGYSTTQSLFGVNLVDGIHSDNTHLNGICEIYKCVQGYNPSGGINDTTQDNAFAVGSTFVSTNWNLLVRDSRYTDATAFKTAMNGVKCVCKLATPQTYNLTPTEIKTLLGINNIFADTGNILEGEYFKEL